MNTDRFKFRFWDNHDERFYDESEFILSNLQDDDGLGVFEQCTGICDKNGKLIYEGDRVKFVTGKVGVVKWSSSRSGYYVVIKGEMIPQQLHGSQEIIGNIHEGKKAIGEE